MAKAKTSLEPQNVASTWLISELGELENRFLRLEQALYINHLDEAEQLLSELGRVKDLSIPQATALAFGRGEYNYWRGRADEAEDYFKGALFLSKTWLEDPFCVARARYGLARIESKRGHYDAAVELLNLASQSLKKLTGPKVKYLDALIRFELGVVRDRLGDLERSEEILSKAVKDLRSVEGGRFYGLALNSLGSTLLHLGKNEEALSNFTKAAEIFSKHSISDELAEAQYNSAIALIRLRRFQEAERLLLDRLEQDKRLANSAREARSLALLTELYQEAGDELKAARYGEQAVEVAEASKNDLILARALVAWGKTLASMDRTKTINVLQRAIKLAAAQGEKREQIEAYIHLAGLTSVMDRNQARQHLEEATKLLEECPDKYLSSRAEEIKAKLMQNPIERTEDKLIIYKSMLPTWKTAKRSLEIFLLKSALEQVNYSGTEAARLLKISKATVTEKRKLYKF